jgi:hypothetical protein
MNPWSRHNVVELAADRELLTRVVIACPCDTVTQRLCGNRNLHISSRLAVVTWVVAR